MNAPYLAAPLAAPVSPLATLLDLGRRARLAQSLPELRFLLVNDTHALTPYRQGALWFARGGVQALSGVVQIEANAPYVQWLGKVFAHCAQSLDDAQRLAPGDLSPELGEPWAQWLPEHACWVPLPLYGQAKGGAVLFVRDLPWSDHELTLFREWAHAWGHAWQAKAQGARRGLLGGLGQGTPAQGGASRRPLWRRGALVATVLLAAAAFVPVPLTVLAPGEVVPSNPDVVRAPLEGVIGSFAVRPNDTVQKGQLLFSYDDSLVRSRLDVARQALAAAEAEYRQASQQALADPRAKAQLVTLRGRAEERRAEAAFARDQLTRSRVTAPADGVALFDDPTEWIGRPVTVGQRILRIGSVEEVEVEAWIAVGDAIPLPPEAIVRLQLRASPLESVPARVRYVAHEAVERPDGTYAYRLRATLASDAVPRVGLKGTVRIEGEQVSLGYWVMRRPLAALREMTGW